MKKLKFLLPAVTLILFSLIIAGCPTTKARKPDPTPVKLPGKVTLQSIDPTKAPTNVKDIIEKQKDRESFNVVRDGDSVYAVVTRGKLPYKNFNVKFKDIEKLDIGNGRSQIRIQVIFDVPKIFPTNTTKNAPNMRAQIKDKLGPRGEYYPVAVAKLNINAVPEAFSYSVLREKEIPQETMDQVESNKAPANVTPESSVNQQPRQPQQPQAGVSITVSTPPTKASVTTPLVITGKATNASMVTIDLKDNKGNLLVSKTVSVSTTTAGEPGDFNTTLTFNPLTQPIQGTLEVYSKSTTGTKEGLVTIPLTLK